MIGANDVLNNLDKYINGQKDKMRSNMGRAMTIAENESKRSAPWRDRTGNARNSIFGTVGPQIEPIIGYHGIGVFYGKYLELSNQGRFRIVWPTMDWLRPQFLGIIAGQI